MRIIIILGIFLFSSILIGCPPEDSEDTYDPPDPDNGFCPCYPVHSAPITYPPFSCGQPGYLTEEVIRKLNTFWESEVIACSCMQDAYIYANCTNNGFVLNDYPGYIYYDASFLNWLDENTGSTLPADWFLAHEFGHNIQLALNLVTYGKQRELQADCLGGYFIGWRICKKEIGHDDVISIIEFACDIGDPAFSPWWATGSHGTCFERVSAVEQGINGYLGGLLPGQACP